MVPARIDFGVRLYSRYIHAMRTVAASQHNRENATNARDGRPSGEDRRHHKLAKSEIFSTPGLRPENAPHDP